MLPMEYVDSLRKSMQAVSEMTLEAEQGGISWTGVGHVCVSVSEDGNTLVFSEKGFWNGGEARLLTFGNECVWHFKEDVGELHFMRQRMESGAPELLVQFVYDAASHAWMQKRPHICGSDCYGAQLKCTGTTIILSWDISGPKKQDRVSVVYS